jgi:hypothetical protein
MTVPISNRKNTEMTVPISSVVWAGEIGVVWGKSRISTRNRKNTEMTVPISYFNEKPKKY